MADNDPTLISTGWDARHSVRVTIILVWMFSNVLRLCEMLCREEVGVESSMAAS